MILPVGLQALLSSNSIRVLKKFIHNLISSWLISFTYFSKIVRFCNLEIFECVDIWLTEILKYYTTWYFKRSLLLSIKTQTTLLPVTIQNNGTIKVDSRICYSVNQIWIIFSTAISGRKLYPMNTIVCWC